MLPPSHRLNATKEFQNVLKKGRRLFGQFVTVRYDFLAAPAKAKFGFIVSTKISKLATRRNRIKRLLRENIRTDFLPRLVKPLKAVIIAKPEIVDKDFWQIKQDLEQLFSKTHLIK